jgi:very-short-patch-repair endonuclease
VSSGRSVYLDAYAEREVDLRRDAHLAALGVLVVRFTHRRLVHETAAVREEVLAILIQRRSWLAPPI